MFKDSRINNYSNFSKQNLRTNLWVAMKIYANIITKMRTKNKKQELLLRNKKNYEI
jgi:hypothetical protein